MLITLKKSDYDFLKKIDKKIIAGLDVVEKSDSIEIKFTDKESLDDWDDNLTFAIVHYGLDDQEEVNEVGQRMYEIYDDISDV
ncbi:hypothetical protein [Enterococcus sp. AZ103]|uniref:hypothetical protein n=1 Tax=Enterococcus sp. AZ103 TaxID=2774628 RepID=UPI003F208EEB